MSKLAQAATVAVAVVICAWFALGFVQARDTSRATALLTRATPLSRAEAARTGSLLGSAGTLNPDLTVDVLRGALQSEERNYAAAERTLLSVTRREPDNLEAWVQLAFVAAQDGDHTTAVAAARKVSALHPRVG
jgi:Flp pilus assembly protein TadD